MSSRVIRFKLSESEIDEAIKQLTEYRQEIVKKTELLREKVAERLRDEVRMGFDGAIVDEQILKGGSISLKYAQVDVSIDNRGSVTVVVASGEDAVWVEFGTGVHYNGSLGSSPHPHGTELGMTIGGFGKGNGKKETWGFYDEGELKLSHGIPARMPMSNAVITICNSIQEIAKEVFS